MMTGMPRPEDDDFESIAHDLLGVNLDAPDGGEEPLELDGLGLDDLGFSAPPSADESAGTPSAEAAASSSPVTSEAPAESAPQPQTSPSAPLPDRMRVQTWMDDAFETRQISKRIFLKWNGENFEEQIVENE